MEDRGIVPEVGDAIVVLEDVGPGDRVIVVRIAARVVGVRRMRCKADTAGPVFTVALGGAGGFTLRLCDYAANPS